jgi:hypothetical protein
MHDHEDNQAFLDAANEAFAKESDAAAACLEHRKECWLCHHPFLARLASVLVRCNLRELLFDHMTAKVDADEYRPGVEFLLIGETADWCAELYRLEDKRTRSGI